MFSRLATAGSRTTGSSSPMAVGSPNKATIRQLRLYPISRRRRRLSHLCIAMKEVSTRADLPRAWPLRQAGTRHFRSRTTQSRAVRLLNRHMRQVVHCSPMDMRGIPSVSMSLKCDLATTHRAARSYLPRRIRRGPARRPCRPRRCYTAARAESCVDVPLRALLRLLAATHRSLWGGEVPTAC